MSELLIRTKVWYSIQSGGDGSAYPYWFLTKDETQYDQDNMEEGWGETCNGSVETFEGSDIHKKAIENSLIQQIIIGANLEGWEAKYKAKEALKASNNNIEQAIEYLKNKS